MPRGVNMYDEGRIQQRNFAASDNIQIIFPGVVTDGLVLNLDAGNYLSYPAANTKWYDLTDNLNNGNLTNGPTFTTENGGAIVFDGVDDVVELGGPNTLNLPYLSCEMWIKLDQPSDNLGQAFFARQNVSLSTFTFGKNTSNLIFFNHRNNANTLVQMSIGGYTIPANWICIVASYDGAAARLYINAEFKSSVAGSGPLNTSGTLDIKIALNNNNLAPFPGNVAITRLYNRALSPAEISQNFNATRARFGI
jgi:hypothetical protein